MIHPQLRRLVPTRDPHVYHSACYVDARIIDGTETLPLRDKVRWGRCGVGGTSLYCIVPRPSLFHTSIVTLRRTNQVAEGSVRVSEATAHIDRV